MNQMDEKKKLAAEISKDLVAAVIISDKTMDEHLPDPKKVGDYYYKIYHEILRTLKD